MKLIFVHAVSADEASYHGANNELRELPAVELSTLPSILKVQSYIARLFVCQYIQTISVLGLGFVEARNFVSTLLLIFYCLILFCELGVFPVFF